MHILPAMASCASPLSCLKNLGEVFQVRKYLAVMQAPAGIRSGATYVGYLECMPLHQRSHQAPSAAGVSAGCVCATSCKGAEHFRGLASEIIGSLLYVL